LLGFSCYKGWKKACQATRAISTTSRSELSSSFFVTEIKGAEGNSHHCDINYKGTCNIVCESQNWVAQLKRGDFSTSESPRPGRPKTVTTLEIIDQIHELILEDRRISAKSIAEKRASHMSGLGPSFMKIWTCGSSPRSMSRNAWRRNKNVNEASRLSNFWNFFGVIQIISRRARLVTKLKTWLYHYEPETRNSQWSGGIAPHLTPKFPSAKIRWKHSRLDFLGSRQYPLYWLPSKWPNYQGGVLLISAGANEAILKGKHRRKITKRVLLLHDIPPANRALANQKKLAYLGFQCLDHPPYSPDLAPSEYHLFPWLKINRIEIWSFFFGREGHCCRGDLVGRTIFWHFLGGLQKL